MLFMSMSENREEETIRSSRFTYKLKDSLKKEKNRKVLIDKLAKMQVKLRKKPGQTELFLKTEM
jgi:uncharacterized tellurite resistance protein B-like protein